MDKKGIFTAFQLLLNHLLSQENGAFHFSRASLQHSVSQHSFWQMLAILLM